MRSRGVMSSALFASASMAELLTTTRVAPDSTITKAPTIPHELLRKQESNDRFIGWTLEITGWDIETVPPDYTIYQSEQFWTVCPTTGIDCRAPVDCISGSVVYEYQTSGSFDYITSPCTDEYSETTQGTYNTHCNTATSFESIGAIDPTFYYFCAPNPYDVTYYRERPVEASSSSSSASESSSMSQSTTSESTSSSATSTTEPSSEAPASTFTPLSAPEKKQSQAWIAGAVIGPIGGLAFVIFATWFFLRRRKNKNSIQSPPVYEHYQDSGPGLYPGSPLPPPASFYSPSKPATPPVGVASHQSWSAPPHLSPQSANAQQWQPMEGQQVYPGQGVSPISQNGQLNPTGSEQNTMDGYEQRAVSMELDGSEARVS